MLFWWAPFDYLYFLFFFANEPGLGTLIGLTPFTSSVGWYKIRTHDPLIINLVRYPLGQIFALSYTKLTIGSYGKFVQSVLSFSALGAITINLKFWRRKSSSDREREKLTKLKFSTWKKLFQQSKQKLLLNSNLLFLGFSKYPSK